MTTEHAGTASGTHAQPLLTGALRARAVDAVLDVARALRTPAEVAAFLGVDAGEADASLAGGSAGIALLYAYLAGAERAGAAELSAARIGEEDHAAVATRHLEAAIEAMATRPMGAGLYSGFSGIAWAVAHVDELLGAHAPQAAGNAAADAAADAGGDTAAGDGGEQDEGGGEDGDGEQAGGDEIDHALLDLARIQPWRHDYDLISGLAGMGVYALERLRHPAAQACLAAIVDRLDELAERQPAGVTWHTSPALLPAHQRAQCPGGYYNLGLAHGVPGVIGLLAGAWAAGVARDHVGPLLQQAVAWLQAHALPPGRGARYAWVVAPEAAPEPTRSAWCYGDPGVAAAVLLAGQATGNASFLAAARELGLGVAARPRAEAGVVDAGLCHGSAGLGLVLYRLYLGTGDPALAEGARAWLAATLDMRDPGAGDSVAGFRAYGAVGEGRLDWEPDPGMLTGAAGVALALLAGLGHVSPDWDRALMLSLPRSARPG
jgi:hypothetical protein